MESINDTESESKNQNEPFIVQKHKYSFIYFIVNYIKDKKFSKNLLMQHSYLCYKILKCVNSD